MMDVREVPKSFEDPLKITLEYRYHAKMPQPRLGAKSTFHVHRYRYFSRLVGEANKLK